MFYNKEIFHRCFSYRGRYWYKNIKYVPLYFKLIHHLVKYGYDERATWETFSWFISTMKSILIDYKNNHCGVPILIDNYPMDSGDDDDKSKALRKQNEEIWNGIIERMFELLCLMDECNPKYDSEEYDYARTAEEMNKAKDEFFKLFAEHFYSLWD